MKIKFLAILLLPLLIFSCNNEKNEKEIDKINKLLEKNNEIKSELNGSFKDSAFLMYDSLKNLNSFFKENNIQYLPDNDSLRFSLQSTRNAQKILGNLKNKHLEYFNENLDQSEKQLKDLKFVISKGSIDDSLKNEYINEEDSAANFIFNQVESKMDISRKYFKNFSAHKENVRYLKKLIKNRNSTK